MANAILTNHAGTLPCPRKARCVPCGGDTVVRPGGGDVAAAKSADVSTNRMAVSYTSFPRPFPVTLPS